ncbi:hypothetical protein MBM_04616 [Drepanopeziza brunnea f. sp. 'multigermtubi' MB_m1]|uniref:Uncharacterized protein n=2 Tax=Drepanopeziza brunnea f. sp. 'multigermtubi' TaxID=698441 RepID=K1XWA8_MARBU|nr:uncharacterized protein MBM_04616 [Drepanopeziza brunnea f. sp. 'multigermtubi' MB_m1]EKD17039.1 hypothetical protein MBM_04616 [Drepanopeziza brunnea f. sp. 'multigermtubi' MB_m1]
MDRSIANSANWICRDEPRRPLEVVGSSFERVSDIPSNTFQASYSTSPQNPRNSTVSTVSRTSKRIFSDSASRRSSASTADSTVPSTQSFQLQPSISSPPPWYSDLHGGMTPVDYNYDLPCEFVAHGCNLRFHPENYQDWLSHSTSHFMGFAPPPSTICIFCDQSFKNPEDPNSSWTERMTHIGSHYQEGHDFERSRPDFFLLRHLKECRLITDEEYESLASWSERKPCEGLVDRDFKSPEMVARELRNSRIFEQPYDSKKEERQRRSEHGKGKKKDKTETYQQIHRPQVYQEHRS